MRENENIRFFRLLTEDETINKNLSPLKYGISGKSAKRIFDAFSVHLINMQFQRHEGINSSFFRIKAEYLINQKQKIYCLTIEIQKNKRVNKRELKEYFYYKFITFLLFRENRNILSQN